MNRRHILKMLSMSIAVRPSVSTRQGLSGREFIDRLRRGERVRRCDVTLDEAVALAGNGWTIEDCVVRCVPHANGDLIRIVGGNCAIVNSIFVSRCTPHDGSAGRVAFG